MRAGQDIGNQYYHLGQIGCPILLVAQNAIIKCQFPAYIYESLASNRYKNWCQMSGRLFAVFLDIIKTYCGLEQSIWGFSLPIFWALFNDISLEKTNNEISHCAACPEKMWHHIWKIAKNDQKWPNDISLEKTNNEISHCAACPEKFRPIFLLSSHRKPTQQTDDLVERPVQCT